MERTKIAQIFADQEAFGGKNGYIQAIRDLQKEIYAA